MRIIEIFSNCFGKIRHLAWGVHNLFAWREEAEGGIRFRGYHRCNVEGGTMGGAWGVGVALLSIEFLMVNFGKKKKSSHSIFFWLVFLFCLILDLLQLFGNQFQLKKGQITIFFNVFGKVVLFLRCSFFGGGTKANDFFYFVSTF